jgi:hypothetical protein
MQNNAADAMISALNFVTKDWARLRKQEEQHRRRETNRYHALLRTRKLTIKEAVEGVIEDAYKNVTGDRKLPCTHGNSCTKYGA